jgi:hypothetical protein
LTPAYPVPSSVRVSLLAEPGTRYDTSTWLGHDGEPNGSVRYDPPGGGLTIQGPPVALRELAAALALAAEQTEQTYPAPEHEEEVAG